MSGFRRSGNEVEKHRGGAITAALIVLMLALAVLSPACGGKTSAPSAFDQETIGQLEQAVHEALKKDGIPGAIVGAWVPGRGEWTRSMGLADRETGEEMEIQNLMRIGSITKSFTATLVL